MITLADSHCHLDFNKYDQDRETVIDAARQAGVRLIINPGADLASSRRAVELAGRYEGIYAAVGVHPHDASSLSAAGLRELRDLAARPGVVAIGEIGLDYYRNYSPHAAQREAFRAQLELAADLDLPVIVHNRDASQDVYALLSEWAAGHPGRQGVLHSYSGGMERLDQTLELGFHIGISGPVTFPGASDLQNVATRVPLESMLLETDAPFLTPVPHRGRRNQPAYVRFVAETVARLRGMELQPVAEQTTRNVSLLFKIGNTVEEAWIGPGN